MSTQATRMCTKQAAAYVGLHPSTLAKLRIAGEGPAFQKLGRKVVYATAHLDDWLASRTFLSTSEYATESS